MLRKAYELAEFKALPDKDGETGRFTALVSVFGNVDYQQDKVMPGAFSKSLEKWRDRGKPIPIIWSHDWGDPFAHIGKADPNRAQETSKGLVLEGRLDVEKPFAAQVYDLLKEDRVVEWSFSYDVIDEKMTGDRVNELREVDLIEAGPTLKGANDQTETIGVKARLEHAAKAGRVISAKNEASLRQARDMIDAVLSSLEKEEETKAEEADGQKSPPWHVEARGGQYCVIKDEDGSTVACHDTESEANAQLQALYANEGKAEEPESKDEPPQDDGKIRRDELIQRIRVLTMDVA